MHFCSKTAIFQTSSCRQFRRGSRNCPAALNNRSTGADNGSVLLNLMKSFATERNNVVVGYHVTSLEETGDLAFLHLTGLDSRPLTALKQTHKSLYHWQKVKLHLALAQFCAAHEGIGIQRLSTSQNWRASST